MKNEVVKCKRCDTYNNLADAEFCTGCKTNLTVPCKVCGVDTTFTATRLCNRDWEEQKREWNA